MSLFTVNRYLAEEDHADASFENNQTADEKQLEQERLQKLLKKAKKRKSQVETDKLVETISNNDITPDSSAKKSKKNKSINSKTKDEINPSNVALEVNVISNQSSLEHKENEGKNLQNSNVKKQNSSSKVSDKSNKKKRTRAKKKVKKGQLALTGTELGVDVGGFTVIGDVNQFRQNTVKRILPDWLSSPSIISCNLKDDKAPINGFNLDSQIVHILEQNFIPYFFPVQQQVIPWLISGHNPKLFRPSDICVSAPTGSGKTLAYALPIIHILKACRIYPCVRAVIVLPTEVLATQVFSVFKTYSKGSGLSIFLMSKRLTLSAERESLIKIGATGRKSTPFDIIVATPGRLIDHLEETDGFNISQLKFLVVDEADRTLDDQEGEWLQRLEAKFWASHPIGLNQPWKSIPLTIKWMPAHRLAFQKLLFSATLSQNPETLEKLHLFQPKLFTSIVQKKTKLEDSKEIHNEKNSPTDKADKVVVPSSQVLSDSFVGKYTTPTELKESFTLCKKETKPLVLTYLISHFKWKRVLCFANTKESTHRLCLLLKFMGHLNVREISSKWSPKTRDMVLKKFNDGTIDILVTSDQMARGIDIPTVDYVISYDLPGYTKTYIHRIGRCARAGKEGHAVSLVLQEQIGIYKKTMKQSGKTDFSRISVKNSDLRPLEESFKAALTKLKTQVQEETEASSTHKKSKLLEDKNKKISS